MVKYWYGNNAAVCRAVAKQALISGAGPKGAMALWGTNGNGISTLGRAWIKALPNDIVPTVKKLFVAWVLAQEHQVDVEKAWLPFCYSEAETMYKALKNKKKMNDIEHYRIHGCLPHETPPPEDPQAPDQRYKCVSIVLFNDNTCPYSLIGTLFGYQLHSLPWGKRFIA